MQNIRKLIGRTAFGLLVAVGSISMHSQAAEVQEQAEVQSISQTEIYVAGNETETNFWIKAANVPQEISGVKAAVWSEDGGQDDLRWYPAVRDHAGDYSMNILVNHHRAVGIYYADLYSEDGRTYLGGVKFQVSGISVDQIKIANKNDGEGTFQVLVSGVRTKSGVSKIQIPVWSSSDQSDLHWYTAVRQGNGTYVAQVQLKNHRYHYGTYYADAYVTAQNGVVQSFGRAVTKVSLPTAQVWAAGNPQQTIFWLAAKDVGAHGGVKKVRFAVWSQKNGQDDLRWYEGVNAGNGVWTAEVITSLHKTPGKYYADAYMTDCNGKVTCIGSTTFQVTGPGASSVKVTDYNEAAGTFGIRTEGVSSTAGIASVQVAVWCAADQSDLRWYDAARISEGVYTVMDDVRKHQNNIGKYYADVYVTDWNGIRICVGGTNCSLLNVSSLFYSIMGRGSVSVEQLMAYYQKKTSYPSFYASSDAPTLRDFCCIYIEECNAEGVRTEVAFCQAMKETNFLRYGSNVKIHQYNFAGIGSTGKGVPGNSFSSVREGIRAQVQHLKAYASAAALNNPCVDPRFVYVKRNTAPYTEWLGINENPYGKGWATAKNYGYQIVDMIRQLKGMF